MKQQRFDHRSHVPVYLGGNCHVESQWWKIGIGRYGFKILLLCTEMTTCRLLIIIVDFWPWPVMGLLGQVGTDRMNPGKNHHWDVVLAESWTCWNHWCCVTSSEYHHGTFGPTLYVSLIVPEYLHRDPQWFVLRHAHQTGRVNGGNAPWFLRFPRLLVHAVAAVGPPCSSYEKNFRVLA